MSSMASEFDFLDDPQNPSNHQFLPRSTSPYSISSEVSSTVDPFYTPSDDAEVDNDTNAYITEENDFSNGNYDLEQELGRGDRWSEDVQHDLTSLAAWETRVKERAQELQLNHALLQHQAMISKEQAGRVERDMLLLRLTEAEQDKLLLEAKLREVVSFEHGQSQPGQQKASNKSLSSLLKGIRGKLLDVANDKIYELSETLRRSDGETANDTQQWEQLLAERESEITALREETVRLSQQLAQRTVLFSAQDRRWRESMRSHLSLQTEQSRDLLNARARLQQLESVYERTDRERLEQHVRCVHLQEEVDELRTHLADESDRVNTLDAELTEAIRLNAALQSNVERLRGVDVIDLERELATELEDMRRASRDTELQLSRQLEEARERMAQEAEARSQLLEELQHLREMVASHEQYHHQQQDDLGVDRHVSGREAAAAAGGEVDSLMSLSHHDPCDHDQHGDLSRSGWVEHPEDEGHHDNDNNNDNNKHESQTALGELASSSSAEIIRATAAATTTAIAAATVTSTIDFVNDDDVDADEDEDGGEERVDLEDVKWLRLEVQRLTDREISLVRALEQHKGRLALVLHRAALLSSPSSSSGAIDHCVGGNAAAASIAAASASATINQLRHTLAEKDKHIATLQEHATLLVQQLDGYRVEVTLLEDQCQQSKEVGVLMGVAQSMQREERLCLRIEDLSSEIGMLKDKIELLKQRQTCEYRSGVLLTSDTVAAANDDDAATSEQDTESQLQLVSAQLPISSIPSERAVVDDCVLRTDTETVTGDDDAIFVDDNGEPASDPVNEQLLSRLQGLEEALAEQCTARQRDAEAAARALDTETAVLREEVARGATDLALLHHSNDQLSMRLADLVELRQQLTVGTSSSVALTSTVDEDAARELETERATRLCLQERLEVADRARVALALDHEAETSRLLALVEQLQSVALMSSADAHQLEHKADNALSEEPSREAALEVEVAVLQQEVSRLTTVLGKLSATASNSQHTEITECDLVISPVADVAEMKNKLALVEAQCLEARDEAQQLRDQVTALLPPREAIDDQHLCDEAEQAEKDKALVALGCLPQQPQQSIIHGSQGMERDESSEKALALVALRRQHKTEMKLYRWRISTRCRALIDRQKAQFVAEREQTVQLVRQECADIVAEAQIMMQRNRERNQHHYRSFPPKVPPRHGDFTPGGLMSPPSSFYDPMAATVVSDASASPGPEQDQHPTMMSPSFDGRQPQ